MQEVLKLTGNNGEKINRLNENEVVLAAHLLAEDFLFKVNLTSGSREEFNRWKHTIFQKCFNRMKKLSLS